MSSNRTDLTLMLDNRANVSKETVGLVKISGNNINVFEINADGANNNSQVTFNNIVVPNYNTTIISRNIRVRYQLTVRVDQSAQNATSPVMAGPLGNFVGGTVDDGTVATSPVNTVLRAFPLQSVCNNVQVIINGATTSLNTQQCLSALQRTLPYDWIKQQATECPCQADNQSYFVRCEDGTALVAGVALGNSNQVFSSAMNSDQTTRASFIATSVATTAGGTATYNFDVSESILLSPFTLFDSEVWLSNVNTMSLMFNINNILDMLLFANAAVASPTAAVVNILNPKLEISYMQLNPDLVTIPRVTTLPYENIVYFPKVYRGMTLNTNVPFQMSTDTLRLSSTPALIYLFGRPQIANRALAAPSASADSFLSIGNLDGSAGLSVSIGTRTGLLASASCKTLYRMSKKNGYRGSFFDWMYGSGALIIIDIVEDLGINVATDCLPGESGSVNFQVSATWNAQNILYGGAGPYNNAAVDCEVMTVVVYAGTANITPDGCVFNTGELSHSEVDALIRTAPKNGNMASTETYKPTIHAGSLFSKFKSVLGTVANGLKSDAGQKALGMASDYLSKKDKGGVFTRS